MNPNFRAAIDDRAICLFVEKLQNGTNHALGGGCFFMKPNIVLTARHVLEGVVERQRPVFLVNGREHGRLTGARPLHFYPHENIDLALVEVSNESERPVRPLFPAHHSLSASDGFLAIGYDRDLSCNGTNSWVLKIERVASFQEEVRTRTDSPVEYILNFSAPWMKPGYSGGPVIAAGGGVAAVLIQQYGDASGESPMSAGRATAVYPVIDLFRSPFECPNNLPTDARVLARSVEHAYSPTLTYEQ